MTVAMKNPNLVKNRCYWSDFVEHVLAQGGSRKNADFLWNWLMAKRQELGVRTKANYLTWNVLLKAADGEPSVALSKQGLWRLLTNSIDSITRIS